MPPSASMTSQERDEYQKNRNRRKQQQFRARQKARLEELEEAAQGARASTSTSHSSDAQKRSRSDADSDDVDVKVTRSEEALRRMEQRLLELGESELGIQQLLDGPASSSSRSSSDHGPSRNSLRPPSNVARSSVFASPAPAVLLNSSDVTSISRFAALLNDFSPPHYSHNQAPTSFDEPITYSHTSQPSLEVDRLRLALELSKQPLPSTLPSWTYASPVDASCQDGSLWSNQQRAADWKWRLFELHRACHNNRSHPTEGYLRNRVTESTMLEIQLLIYQLLGRTSIQKDFYDAKRALSTEDRLFLEFTPLDPRIEWLPDPLVRVLVTKASRSGLLQLTELLGNGIETARIFGDVWRWDTWTMPEHSYKAPLPQSVHISDEMLCAGGPVGNYHGAAVVGSSIRDIVLGLELPGWRTFDTGPIKDDNQKLVDYADKAKLWEKQLEARRFSNQGVLAGRTAEIARR